VPDSSCARRDDGLVRSRSWACALVCAAVVLSGCQGQPDRPRSAPATPTPSRSTTSPTPEPAATRSPRPRAPEPTGQPDRRAGQSPLDLTRRQLNTRLIAAAWDNDVRRARRLVRAGADVNAKDETEQSAYLISTSEGHLRLLELTFRHGADVDSLDSFNGTGLIRAAERGHADIVGRLLQTDIEVDHVNRLGWTALHEAIILGDGSREYVDTVRLLVAAGADVDLPSERDGLRPLRHAESRGFDRIATTLRKALRSDRGQRIPRTQADRRLLRAARRGDADGVAVALRHGADLESRDDKQRTPLLLSALRDHVDVARLLVALGADPDAQDSRQDSAWLVTGVTGSVRMLETLLPANPDLELENRFGGLSVIPASERGHVRYVRRVVQTPIDVNHVNDLGWTAMLEAVILGDGSRPYQRIVRTLLDAGADPSIADSDGVTPLQHARSRGFEEIVAILERR
jgi:ankyrin repeat protein